MFGWTFNVYKINVTTFKDMTKQCFTCRKDLPIKNFKKIPEGDYQQKSWKGTQINCRNCNIKREIKKGLVRRIDGKFQIMNWSKEEIISDNLAE